MKICLMKNECRDSSPISSSIFLHKMTILVHSLHSHCFGDHFWYIGLVKVTSGKFFQDPLLHLKMAALSSPLSLLLSVKCLFTFSMWICPLVPLVHPACPRISLPQEHMLSLYLPALPSWDLQTCLNRPHSLKHVPQAYYPLTLLTSTSSSFHY